MNVFARRTPAADESRSDGTLALAHYLGTRPDLVPIAACARLQAVARTLSPLTAVEVHSRLDASIGPQWRTEVAELEDSPIDVHPARQVHRAVIDGTAALVILSRPWPHPRPSEESLAPLIPGDYISGDYLRTAIADYTCDCRHAADADAQRAAWQMRSGQDQGLPFRVSATANARLAAPDVLVLHVSPSSGPRGNAVGPHLREVVTDWFCDVLLSNPFSVQPLSAWAGSPAAWDGGVLDTLPSSCASQLRTYLVCVAAEEPDRACSTLTALFQRLSTAGELRLARDLRQFVPTRDWKWPGNRPPVAIADQLLGHWRAVSVTGGRAPRHLLSFYRGLYGIAAASRDLDPDGTVIADAFHDALVAVSVEKTRRLLTPEGLATNVFDLARLAVILPRSMDEGLSHGAEERAEAHADETWMHAERTDLSMSLLSGVLVFMVAGQLAATEWSHSLFPLLVATVAILLVVVIVRSRRRERQR